MTFTEQFSQDFEQCREDGCSYQESRQRATDLYRLAKGGHGDCKFVGLSAAKYLLHPDEPDDNQRFRETCQQTLIRLQFDTDSRVVFLLSIQGAGLQGASSVDLTPVSAVTMTGRTFSHNAMNKTLGWSPKRYWRALKKVRQVVTLLLTD